MKKVIISVTNDLISDSRVHKVSQTLHNQGWDIVLIGRKLRNSLELTSRVYKTKRMKLFFENGFLFYAEYNLRLFFYLLFQPSDVLLSNDLDTLLPNFIISKLKRKELYYDTHEYFTGVPELINRGAVRWIWEFIERLIFPKLKHVYTVNESIASLYRKKYGVSVSVVRNVPVLIKNNRNVNVDPLNKIILYQGAVNKDRGLEEMIAAMVYIENASLVIIGGGDVLNSLKLAVKDLQLEKKVKFISKVPFEELRKYTETATIGLCIEKDTNINYRYCLPNKLFDYIHAEIPVVASSLVEIKQIVLRYDIGTIIDSDSPVQMAEVINRVLSQKEQLKSWKVNAKKAALELNWQNEEQELLKVFSLNSIN